MKNYIRKLVYLLAVVFLLFFWQKLCIADTYRYVDKNGVVVFTDDKESIPLEFRKNVTVIKDEEVKNKQLETKKDVALPANSNNQQQSKKQEEASTFYEKLKNLQFDNLQKPIILVILSLIFIFAGYLLKGLNNRRIVTIIRLGIVIIISLLLFQTYLEKVNSQYEDLKADVNSLQKKAIKRDIKLEDITK